MSKVKIENIVKTLRCRKFRTIYLNTIGLFFAFFIIADNCVGQTQGTASTYTPPSVAAGRPIGSYPLSGFENVNPYSGKLNFSLPLYNVGGRGEVSYIQNLVIERSWNIAWTTFYMPPGTPPSGQPGQWRVDDTLWNEPRDIPAPGIVLGRKSRDRNPGNSASVCYTLSRISWIGQDKTEIEMRDVQTNGSSHYGGYNETFARGTIFKSYDGSNVTFVSDSTVTDVDCGDIGFSARNGIVRFSPSGYLYFANGVKYRITNGSVSWMQDRNGNRLEMNGRDNLGRTPNTYGFGGVTKSVGTTSTPLAQRLRAGYTLKSPQELFPNVPYANGGPPVYYFAANPNVISEVVLPDGRKYEFFYNSYAELARVILPTGGAIEYDWGPPCVPNNTSCWESGLFSNSSSPFIRRVIRERRTYKADGFLETVTKFDPPLISPVNPAVNDVSSVMVFDGANNLLSKTIHYYHGGNNFQWYPDFRAGREYKTEIYDGNNNLLRVTNNIWRNQGGPQTNTYGSKPNNPYLEETSTTLVETNQVSKQFFAYDVFNNQTDVYEYDYGVGAPGLFKRRTHTDYVVDPNYTAYTGAHLRSLPLQTWTSPDASGATKASLTQFEYDGAPLLPRSNAIGHDTANYDVGKTNRGNVTRVTSYSNAQNSTEPISSYSNYDILGNVVRMIDAKGNSTTIEYSDKFGAPDGEARANTSPTELGGLSTFAFPTSATNALGWVTGYSQFDFYTGQAVDVEDINGVVSSAFYDDPLDRPTKTIAANNQPDFRRQTTIAYDDANRKITSTSDLDVFGDSKLRSESYYDGLGRTVETRKFEADGGYVAVRSVPFTVIPDPETGLFRVATQVSNPYRPNAGEQPVWTTSLNDSLGRGIKIITPDGAFVKTAFSGNAVTVTDQAGRQRRSITNALGQLTRVDEPDVNGTLGTVDAPVQPTFYEYDTLNNLTRVNQGVQLRTFQYDSLSRLKAAQNPESGLMQYQYDNNGNLTQKTDARGITTAYSYDALNRVQTRSYSDGITPNVTYTYDNLPNAKGRLTRVSNGFSTTEYTQFDQLGRVTQSQQTTDGAAYPSMQYSYNLAGSLIEQRYPSGRVVKNTLDDNGDLSLVQSKKNQTAGYLSYAKNFTYTATGAVSSLQLGNNKWESTAFNSRLQPTQIALGTTPSNTDLLKLNFDYGATNNNGNVISQTISVPTTGNAQGFTAVQTYAYDALNRLQDASETISGTQSWRQAFTYDRYGNRNFAAGTTTIPQGCSQAVCNPTVDPNTNKLVGYTFDGAGNTKIDAQGRGFTYDAENKQTEVRDGNNIVVGRYYYDGDGKRVKKASTTETTVFVYDASGKMVAEYSNQTNTTPQISYLTSDHLGSPRIITNGAGNVTSRRDFQPFGEEVRTWYRVPNLGYAVDDDVRQKFTGYERDDESELNYAKARYQNPNHGRFTSPDPAKMTKARTADPQHWNLYVYARNNPLVLVDITGEFPWRFLVRSFIYTSTVGPGGTFRGDGRAPSLETDPNIASSRTRLDFTLDYNRGRVTSYAVESDPTVFYGVAGVGRIERTAAPGVKFSSVETYFDKVKSVDFHYWAKDPVTPGFATPNLDVHANIAVSESITRFGSGTLNIAGTFTGDKFPSLEAFVVDQSGKTKVFLGAKYEEGGVGELYGDNKENLFKVDIQIKFDKKGNFTGVIQNGKHYTVDAWNERVQAQF